MFFFFFFNDTATTEIYTLSLHDALPISHRFRAWKPDLVLSVAQRHASLSWPGPVDCLRHDRDGRFRETSRRWPRPLHLCRAARLCVRALRKAEDRDGSWVCPARCAWPPGLRLD